MMSPIAKATGANFKHSNDWRLRPLVPDPVLRLDNARYLADRGTKIWYRILRGEKKRKIYLQFLEVLHWNCFIYVKGNLFLNISKILNNIKMVVSRNYCCNRIYYPVSSDWYKTEMLYIYLKLDYNLFNKIRMIFQKNIICPKYVCLLPIWVSGLCRFHELLRWN